MKKLSIALLVTQFLILACTPGSIRDKDYDYSKMNRKTKKVYQRVDQFLQKAIQSHDPVEIIKHSRIDTVIIDKSSKKLDVYLNGWIAAMPLREENTAQIHAGIQSALGRKFKRYSLTIYAGGQPIEQLIPNFYRQSLKDYDHSRMPVKPIDTTPLVRKTSNPWQISRGLAGRHIALWASHGWYYEQKLDRWEWQRARVFQTVEDLLPMAFTNHYLVPMLENAGAHVFQPRERDIQSNEVVIDNNTRHNSKSYQEYSNSKETVWRTSRSHGFAVGKPPYTTGINPFKSGTAMQIKSSEQADAGVRWIPDIPEKGEYAVHISFVASDQNVTDAHYTVYHSGGQTEFLVNQQIGGSTWIYLGKFKFEAGQNANVGKVELSNQSQEPGKLVTADAVRFGGGMGNISRNGQVSGRPRLTEAARYYLQYAGMPDTLVYNLNEDQKDYNDDYQSRGEWVNYLKGAPFGPNRDRSVTGLGIPI
ncbi:MAG: hypothetical protein KAH12_08825, partial [Anaerolineales bacterium]|nr:hypothetical protein [Anaerolineales bacterium]